MRPPSPPSALLVLATACVAVGCDEVPARHRIQGGDAEVGRRLVALHDCGVCHIVPGVRGAHGTVGPSLRAFGRRAYIAGRVPNEPDHLVRWLADPPQIDPETLMPALGLTPEEQRDIAAYLYSLR